MRRLLTVLSCMAACTAGGLCAGERGAPRLKGESLPVPPRQSARWTPPQTRLSSRLVAATRTLFDQGLPDPRGCEFREIETGEGEGRHDADEQGRFKSHGWVLPADPARPQRFAIRWDGLIYPVASIGKPADLRADMLRLIADWKRGGGEKEDGYLLRLCLLLRLGESDLAERYFDRLAKSDDDLYDPYLSLAAEWTSSLLERAKSAHARGDDPLALLTARSLVRIWDAVEAEATELDLPPKPRGPDSDDRPDDEIPLYLENLEEVRVILGDQERRAKERSEGKGPPLRLGDVASSSDGPFSSDRPMDAWKQVEAKLGRPLDHRQRIALVIRWFEEADEPAGWLAELLRPYRDEAIEPLLDCLEHDTRLSRGPGVDVIAYTVLCDLLETGFDTYLGPKPSRREQQVLKDPVDERKVLVEQIRNHWHKVRKLSPADGWYEILRDDSQSPERWVEAVRKTVAYGGPHVRDSVEATARREAMRKKRNPSVTELLVKRARSLADRGDMPPATELALALAEWDPEAALPILRQQTSRWREALISRNNAQDHRLHWITQEMTQLALARAKLKDATALKDYVALFREVTPEDKPYFGGEMFEPLLTYRDAPEVVAGAEWIFNDPASPWSAVAAVTNIPSLGRSRLLTLPAFRKLVLRTLADTHAIGTANVESHERIHVAAIGYQTETFAGDPLCPPPGSRIEVRRCDACAAELSEILGMPRCELFWPKARRDQAVAQCSRLLRQYGPLLGPDGNAWAASFHFPLLDHSATQQDERDGRAIFSLEGQGPVRCCKLLARPAEARWVSFRQEPFSRHRTDPETGAEIAEIDYHQKGLVWQAEEVQVGGKWQRYYGLAGAGRMTKVPAEEIEFEVDGTRWNGAFNLEFDSFHGQLVLLNRSGLAQPVPQFHAADDPSPAPPGAVSLGLRLYRFTDPDREAPWELSPNFPDPKRGEDRQWEEVPRKPGSLLKIAKLPAQLQPTEAVVLFSFNLNAVYGKLAPGDYRDVAVVETASGKSRTVLRLLSRGYHLRRDPRDR